MDHVGVARIFNQCFSQRYNTVMLGGMDEPIYFPASNSKPAQLYYRQDFAASALHEAAHWCVAGSARRQQPDFGYAYIAPPRDADQQARFFSSEIKAQALESIFARAAGVIFVLSTDDLDSDSETLREAFARRVDHYSWHLLQRMDTGLHKRAKQFASALACVGAGIDYKRQLAICVGRGDNVAGCDRIEAVGHANLSSSKVLSPLGQLDQLDQLDRLG